MYTFWNQCTYSTLLQLLRTLWNPCRNTLCIFVSDVKHRDRIVIGRKHFLSLSSLVVFAYTFFFFFKSQFLCSCAQFLHLKKNLQFWFHVSHHHLNWLRNHRHRILKVEKDLSKTNPQCTTTTATLKPCPHLPHLYVFSEPPLLQTKRFLFSHPLLIRLVETYTTILNSLIQPICIQITL